MRKRKLLLGALILGVAALTACDNTNGSTPTPTPEPTHEHTYANEWSKNETKHWHAATCGDDVKKDEADHTWNDGVETTNGTKFTCTVCGYEKTETSKYQVNETKWKEILNNTFNYTLEEAVTQGSNSMQQNIYFTENGVLMDYVGSDKGIATKENDKYYLYSLTYGETNWTKEEITEDRYNDYYNNSFSVFVNEYSKFTYNLETKKYTLASLDISDTASSSSSYTTLLTNISIGFEDGKLSSLNFTMTMTSISYSASAQLVYKNFGTTTIEIPTDKQIVKTTVTETEWTNLFDLGNNCKIESVSQYGGTSISNSTVYSGDIIYISMNMSGLLMSTYFQKDNDKYYQYSYSDNQWVKSEITKEDYDTQRYGLKEIGTQFYKFTYDEESKSYKAAEIDYHGTKMKNVVIKVEDNKLIQIKYDITDTDSYSGTFLYEEQTIELPQVSNN